jgi:hypothetical protein
VHFSIKEKKIIRRACLKILSSEIDPTEFGLESFVRSSLKREARRFFGKIHQSPILREPPNLMLKARTALL